MVLGVARGRAALAALQHLPPRRRGEAHRAAAAVGDVDIGDPPFEVIGVGRCLRRGVGGIGVERGRSKPRIVPPGVAVAGVGVRRRRILVRSAGADTVAGLARVDRTGAQHAAGHVVVARRRDVGEGVLGARRILQLELAHRLGLDEVRSIVGDVVAVEAQLAALVPMLLTGNPAQGIALVVRAQDGLTHVGRREGAVGIDLIA